MDGWIEGRMDRGMNGRTNGISPHSTGLCPLSVPLPCYPCDFTTLKKQGKGTADHILPFGDWLKMVLRGK